MRTTYDNIPLLIAHKRSFRGNSAWAEWEPNITQEKTVYNVYSYNTLIAQWDDTGIIFFDNTYYSNTTSKLQNIILELEGLPRGRGPIDRSQLRKCNSRK